MPQPRIHTSDAARQAAFRRRRDQTLTVLQQAKGLTPLPSIPTMPGWSRWRQVLGLAEQALREVHEQMNTYYDDRSQEWQESDKAQEFTDRMDAGEELLQQVALCRDQLE